MEQDKQPVESEETEKKIRYEAPAIVYETQITSRAGSPIPGAPVPPEQKEEIKLFPDD
ncbi:MAG: hypothetical protein AAF633_26785 [Chloroflexota bacterium]